MSALSIIVGSWLVLNAVVFVALMFRRDRPALRNSTIPMGDRWQARSRRRAVQSNREPYR